MPEGPLECLGRCQLWMYCSWGSQCGDCNTCPANPFYCIGKGTSKCYKAMLQDTKKAVEQLRKAGIEAELDEKTCEIIISRTGVRLKVIATGV